MRRSRQSKFLRTIAACLLVTQPTWCLAAGSTPAESRKLTLESLSFEFFRNSRGALGIAATENRAYVTTDPGLRIYDISNPRRPVQIGLHRMQNATDVKLDGDYAIVSSGLMFDDEGHLTIVDVSDPRDTRQVGRLEVPHGSISVEIQDGIAYMGAYDKGLFIVDYRKKAAPKHVSTFRGHRPVNPNLKYFPLLAAKMRLTGKTDHFPYTLGRTWWNTIQGRYAYVCDEGSGLYILDVSDPAEPKALSRFNYHPHPGFPNATHTNHPCNDVHVEGDVAAIALDLGGIGFFDVSDKENPKTLSYIEIWKDVTARKVDALRRPKDWRYHLLWMHSPGHTTQVTIEDKIAYAAAGDDGVYVYDIADPTDPILLYHYRLYPGTGTSWGLTKRGNYLFITYAALNPGGNGPPGTGGWEILEIVHKRP